jgi:two-component system NtrC family sensor kinase
VSTNRDGPASRLVRPSGDRDDGRSSGGEGRRVDGQTFFDDIPVGVFIGCVGSASADVTVNTHLKALLGYPPGVVDDRVDPFDPERFVDQQARADFLDTLRREGSVVDRLLRLRRNDGSPLWVEVTATPGGALLRDVSARKRHEDESRDLHHQLLQAEKLAALGQTISGVAHELNNPLATILAWAERLAELPGDEKSRRGLDVILQEAERAARIVRNLLTFARKRQSTRMMVDLNDIVRETMALRTYEQRVSNIQVVQSLAAHLPQVFADGHQVKQILLNLVINAEQAMIAAKGAGTITVRTWHDADRGSVVLEVNDDGPGIAPELQEKIFDPFFTTKAVGTGTGLGLSVAYAIVQEHGGRIWVVSRPHEGSAFFVELPVTGQPLETRRAAPAAVSLEAFQGRSALVVEDEPALATAVSEALSDAGFRVDRAGDGEEGLSRLTEGTYDLIVCDLKMPRIDGMQFYRAIAAATPTLARRVIFVTGAVAGTDAERFLEETGCRWLAKPFRLGDLLRAARDALA